MINLERITELRNEIDVMLDADPTVYRIRTALLGAAPGGMTRTNIRNLFHRNRPAEEVAAALETLRTAGLAHVMRRRAARGPWVRETWYAT